MFSDHLSASACKIPGNPKFQETIAYSDRVRIRKRKSIHVDRDTPGNGVQGVVRSTLRVTPWNFLLIYKERPRDSPHMREVKAKERERTSFLKKRSKRLLVRLGLNSEQPSATNPTVQKAFSLAWRLWGIAPGLTLRAGRPSRYAATHRMP